MNPCVFTIKFSLLLLLLETTSASQLAAAAGRGDDTNGVIMNKCLEKERDALLHFKASLHDPSDTLSTWTADDDECCQWRGVKCRDQTGHITELELQYCGLVGEVSHSLVNLTHLNHLDLSGNSFHGTIPWSIGSLTELRYLDLSFNSLYGAIPPEFGNLTNLQWLWLQDAGRCRVENLEWLSHLSQLVDLNLDGISLAKANHWVDVILSLQKLSYLSLDGCELSQVKYPYSSSFLNSSSSSIQTLHLGNNSLTSSMFHLGLSNNMLGPRFPKWIQSLKNLASLDLSNTGISDTVPLEFWDMWPSQLRYLNLSSNNTTGKIPDLLSNFDEYSVIDLSSNRFYGPIPNVPSTLSSLDLSRNKFSGGISFLCQIVDGPLFFLDLSCNSFIGQLPDCLWRFQFLRVLGLGNNNLSGRISPSIGSLIGLEVLYLYNNNFSGELPLSLKNCTSLNSLNLGANKFTGNVPVWIGENLSQLYVLILRSNNFFGTIPLQSCQLANLQILDLSMNNLHGPIPSCLSNLTSMVQQGFLKDVQDDRVVTGSGIHVWGIYVDHAMIEWQGDEREFFRNLKLLKSIDLSSNNLTGQIPYQITNLSDLISLNLSKNTISGEIPQKIGEMKKLLTLDLSRNNLSGQIPSSMSQMTLLNDLHLSFNNLSGRIPSSTQLQSFQSSTYDGNSQLLLKVRVMEMKSGDGSILVGAWVLLLDFGLHVALYFSTVVEDMLFLSFMIAAKIGFM